jgi:dihydrofolate synthase/folylpolyglutamate synthase
MTYTESLQYLLSLGHETLSMKFGLEGIKALLHELCHPQEGLRSVHIAGTNGKGSTSAMVAEMAHDSGLKTGLYTSPHLVDITERMQINRSPISRDRFAQLATEVRAASERLCNKGVLEAPPSFFEQVTASGFLFFAQEKAELVVLEVGLGGRLDATNICRPIVSAITTIGEDHQQYLGTSLAAIAFEKAGIIKPRVPVVSAPQASEAMRVIQARCEELNSPLVVADEIPDLEPVVSPVQGEGFFRMRVETKKDAYDVHLGLRGRHQAVNALVAIHLGEILGFDRSTIEYGLSASTWPGRLELIRRRSLAPLLIDGAHNADGARALADFLREFHSSQDRLEEITLIFGVMSDKALHHMVEVLFPLATTRIVTRIDNPRSVEPEEIAKVAKRAGWDSIVVESTAEALAKADQITSPNGMICVCGSLYLVGEIKSLL